MFTSFYLFLDLLYRLIITLLVNYDTYIYLIQTD